MKGIVLLAVLITGPITPWVGADTISVPATTVSTFTVTFAHVSGFFPGYHSEAILSFNVPAGNYSDAQLQFELGTLSSSMPSFLSTGVSFTLFETSNPSQYNVLGDMVGAYSAEVSPTLVQNASVELSSAQLLQDLDAGGTIYLAATVSGYDFNPPLQYGTAIGPFSLALTSAPVPGLTATPLPNALAGGGVLLGLFSISPLLGKRRAAQLR